MTTAVVTADEGKTERGAKDNSKTNNERHIGKNDKTTGGSNICVENRVDGR